MILIIICVFDPLAVLLLIAANQSFLRRFPVKAPRLQEIVDLEKPDEEDITLKWNEAMAKQSNEGDVFFVGFLKVKHYLRSRPTPLRI